MMLRVGVLSAHSFAYLQAQALKNYCKKRLCRSRKYGSKMKEEVDIMLIKITVYRNHEIGVR
jgi:hypothetical protein